MATVTAFVRVSAKKSEKAIMRFRLRDGRNIQLFYKSEIEVDPNNWDAKVQAIKTRVVFDGRKKFNDSITTRKNIVLEAYEAEPDKLSMTSEILEAKVIQKLHPEEFKPIEETPQTFFEAFTEFLEKHKLSIGRKRHFQVVKRALQRFELYTAKMTKKPFKISFDTVTKETLQDIETFLLNEFTIFKTMPELYVDVPETRTPQPRGQNTISNIFTKLRTFYHWSIDAEKTTNNPFKGFTVDECIYGTPYYISIDERNILFKTDLSGFPKLAIQRDIFVFQCLIGARVGDFYNMTKSSVINGAVEYIPRKTKDGRPITVRVPLNTAAKEILSRYPDNKNEMLLPFISEQKYNVAIKEAFRIAELTRMVTVINPTTREEEKQPLNKIASSHLARRCFIGNLYKQVKDPNLVGSLSGHKEGSKAFARYREIDEEMKIDLVNLLD
jgi:integrase